MGSIINENIRYYKANDPYYFEVDNLPLRDLVQNDKNLEEAILALAPGVTLEQLRNFAKKAKDRIKKIRISKNNSATAVGREAFDDLLPYVSGNDGKIYVTPGIFSARTSLAPEDSNGLFEKESNPGQTIVGDPLSSYRATNRSFNYPARLEMYQFMPNSDGTDKAIDIPRFSEGDFELESVGGSAIPSVRVDLIGIAAAPDPYLFLIKGAGFGSSYAGSRMFSLNEGGMNTKDSDNDSNDAKHATHTHKFDFETGQRIAASIPLPDDLYNAAEQIIDGVVQSTEETLQFSVPLCYVLVNTGYQAGTALLDNQILDIRPFFRGAELTLDERQAIAVSRAPNIENPFVTKTELDAVLTELDSVKNSIPDVQTVGDFENFGKIRTAFSPQDPNADHQTLSVSLEPGTWLAMINFEYTNFAKSGMNLTSSFGVQDATTGAILTNPFGGTASITQVRNQDDDCNGCHVIPFILTTQTSVRTYGTEASKLSVTSKSTIFIRLD